MDQVIQEYEKPTNERHISALVLTTRLCSASAEKGIR
jgi:hypothetical protein